MTPADDAIARRLRVQCERFGWMGGMATTHGLRVCGAVYDEGAACPALWVSGDFDLPEDALPDPRDPATIGCFAAMARRATGLRLYAVPDNSGTWAVCTQSTIGGDNEPMNPGPDGMWSHATEIEAWLAVLEATP